MNKILYFVGVLFVSALFFGTSANVVLANQCTFIQNYVKFGSANDSLDVEKLQRFLNSFEREHLSLTKKFDVETLSAVHRFQQKYSKEVLEPWGVTASTGYVYVTTKHKINEMYCGQRFDYSSSENELINITPAPIVAMKNTSPDTSKLSSSKPIGSTTLADVASKDDLTASVADSTTASPLRNIFSSGITLVVLLLLLALVIYLMVTNRGDIPPPQNPTRIK
ncbi:MAG: peptidoglycan-binding protein [Candidatus Taylorbacteria bacterium]|nr:peptidoglycan-binding protein [Candidatus Taylorbacteria bacterium]